MQIIRKENKTKKEEELLGRIHLSNNGVGFHSTDSALRNTLQSIVINCKEVLIYIFHSNGHTSQHILYTYRLKAQLTDVMVVLGSLSCYLTELTTDTSAFCMWSSIPSGEDHVAS